MSENDRLDAIRKRIADRRKELGLSYQDLSDRTGMSKSTLQRYETGDIKNVSLDKLEPLAEALQTTPSYLMGWEEEKEFSNAPKINDEDEKDIARTMEKLKEQLMNEQGLMFDGELLDEETIKLVLEEVERQERLIKTINKKYIPKKYRK